MLRLTRISKMGLAFAPERSHRFFTLRVNLRKEIPLSEKIAEQHQKWLKSAEQRGEVLYAVKGKQSNWFQYVFQSPNEVQPYSFVKQSVLHSQNLVESFTIQQLEMQLRVKDKELAPNYLRE